MVPQPENGLQCSKCNRTYARKKALVAHQHRNKCHEGRSKDNLICNRCRKGFSRIENLKNHLANGTCNKKKIPCSSCDQRFGTLKHMKEHVKLKHPEKIEESIRKERSIVCPKCNKILETEHEYEEHMSTEHRDNIQGKGTAEDESGENCITEFGMDKNLVIKMYRPSEQVIDVRRYLRDMKSTFKAALDREIERLAGSIRWYIVVIIEFLRPGNEFVTGYFRSNCEIYSRGQPFGFAAVTEKIMNSIDKFNLRGSGWTIDRVLRTDLNMGSYSPLNGSSYLPLPKKLLDKKSIVNVVNQDQECAKWAFLAVLHHAEVSIKEDPESYRQWENEIKFGDLSFPITEKDFEKLDRLNPYRINLIGWSQESGELFPIFVSQKKAPEQPHITILYYDDNFGNGHYAAITDFDQLMRSMRSSTKLNYWCRRCFGGYSSTEKLAKHTADCSLHKVQNWTLPTGDKVWKKFDHHGIQHKVSHVMYGDIECVLPKLDGHTALPDQKSYTRNVSRHEPSATGFIVVGPDGNTVNLHCYRGELPVDNLLENMFKWEQEIGKLKKINIGMDKKQADTVRFSQNGGPCFICEEPVYIKGGVVDHDHFTGKIRGFVNRRCNLKYKNITAIPTLFHNFKGYDNHLIMQSLPKFLTREDGKQRNTTIIPQTMEKYVSVRIDQIKFLDSFAFMATSLATLVENMEKDDCKNGTETYFKLLKENFPLVNEYQLGLLKQKGQYPYEYMESVDKFKETELPPKEAFYSKVSRSGISDTDYEHVQTVWREFNIKNLGEYTDLYLKTDILLLADVFERFRTVCIDIYGIDPVYRYTSPGLAWEAMLKITGINLQLLTDREIHLMIEKAVRGGLVSAFKRYSKANSKKYLPESFNPSLLTKFLFYVDANNLYGYAMVQCMPSDGHRFMSREEFERLDIVLLDPEGSKGYLFEVDLHYPQHLHDSHADFPMAPEMMAVTEDLLPEHLKQYAQPASAKKLLPNLWDKIKYVIHFALLQFFVLHGLQITKVHRVVEFNQSKWLAKYILLNTKRRMEATNNFEKDIPKLLNNSVYGKTLEKKRKHRNVKLVGNPKQFKKYLAKPTFKSFKRFSDDLVAMEMIKPNVVMDRPIYVGQAILDLSKLLMYQFHYDYIIPKYGGKVKVLYSDTDSLAYEIYTEDLYEDIRQDWDRYDTSDYPKTHPCYSEFNKKVIGKFKDEMNGVPIEEFVAIKAKMYSIKTADRKYDKKIAKGVAKTAVKNDLKHSDYIDVLRNQTTTYETSFKIGCDKHIMYTQEVRKKGLSAEDSKRVILKNLEDTLPFGHYKLNDKEWCEQNLATIVPAPPEDDQNELNI